MRQTDRPCHATSFVGNSNICTDNQQHCRDASLVYTDFATEVEINIKSIMNEYN